MRERILELFGQSRAMMRSQIELNECFYNGNFAPDSSECGQCDYEFECQWLYNNDEFAALERKPLETLLDSLEYAQYYVEAQLIRWGHDKRGCHCEACAWLRDCRQLLRASQRL
jgi:hypothetical protein